MIAKELPLHLLKYLKSGQVLLEMESAVNPPDVAEYLAHEARSQESGLPMPADLRDPRETPPDEATLWRRKEAVVHELAALLDRSGEIRNLSKFTRDFIDRERKSSTAVGGGLAVPHVRSMQPRSLVVAVARTKAGVDWFADDGEPVRVFFCIASPSYDDADYWKLYRWAANIFAQNAWLVDGIIDAKDEHEVLYLLKSLR